MRPDRRRNDRSLEISSTHETPGALFGIEAPQRSRVGSVGRRDQRPLPGIEAEYSIASVGAPSTRCGPQDRNASTTSWRATFKLPK